MKYTFGLIAINLLCAFLNYWNVVIEFSQATMNQSNFMIHLLCALLWTLAAIFNLIRYLKQKEGVTYE